MRRASLLAAIGLAASSLAGLGVHSSAAATVCSVPSVEYPTIQSAVNDPACEVIEVAAGTYAENVTIHRQLVLDGAGAGLTIIDPPATGPAIRITAGDTSAADRLVIRELTTTGAAGAGNIGTGIRIDNGATGHITFESLSSVANGGHGIAIDHTGTLTDLVLDDVDASDNVGTGFRVPTSLVSLDGLTITDSQLERNTTGLEIFIAFSATAQSVSNVLVEDTSFDANRSKGVYAERLDDAIFRRVSVVGSGTVGAFAAGIDINLKFRDYANILIEDSVITDNGSGDPVNGVGITVKARDDAGHPQYGVLPATLTGVVIEGNTVARNTSDGIRFGEPARNNAGPTDVHVNQNNIETNTVFGVNNQSQALTDATCNWWGSPNGPGPVGPGTGDRVSTNVDYEPWLTSPAPGGACAGVTPNPPPSKDACKKDGWRNYTDDQGRPFKNQGDCVSYGATGGRNKANG